MRQIIEGVDFAVDEHIWGHRLYDEQLPHLAMLEFLSVLGSNADKPLREVPGQKVRYRPQRQIRLRGLLFNNPYVEAVRERAISDEDKWSMWGERFAVDADQLGDGDMSYLRTVFNSFDDFAKAIELLRSSSFEAKSNKRWSSKFVFPFGPDAMYEDLRIDADGGASNDRRFFARSGELLYLMLCRASRGHELGDLLVKRLFDASAPMNRLVKALQGDPQHAGDFRDVGYTWNSATYREKHSHYKVWPTNAGRQEMSALVECRSFDEVCKLFPVTTIGSGRSKKRVARPLLVEGYLYFYGVISFLLRGVDFDEVVPPEPGSLDELYDLALAEAGQAVDRTLAASWIHEIRHETYPKVPHHDLPIRKDRIDVLLGTLTDYIQLIELRLGVEDDAQVIFESLNDRGERLTPADLVRNFVFLEATRINASAGKLYEAHWREFDELPAEKGAISKSKLFWKVEERQGRLTNTRLDTLLYHYVSMRTMNDVKLDHVFEEFKQWWLAGKKDVDQELSRLKHAADLFRALVLPDRSTRLGRFAHNLRVLDTSTVTPVVLFLGERLGPDSESFLDCLRVLESYLVRRAVCGRPTKAYNRVFPALLKRLSESSAPSSALVAEHLKGLSGGETQDWPDDAAFGKAWAESNTYKALRPAKTKMLLEALELGCRNEVYHESAQLPSVALHVEHVLPIAWEAQWPAPGDDYAVLLRNHLLHNIGNLTLLTAKLNPSLSNSAFAIKRPEITKSLLALNAYFQDSAFVGPEASWDEKCIRARAQKLFEVAIKVWPFEAT